MRPVPSLAASAAVSSPGAAWLRAGGIAALLAAYAAVPLLFGEYMVYTAAQVMIYAVATLGLEIVYGRAGQLSLAHASFFGLGAYVAALAAPLTVPLWAQPELVVLLAIVAGAVVAVPTLRLSGLRLSLVTLLFGELFGWGIDHSGSLTGGSEGITVGSLTLGGFDSQDPLHAYLLAGALAAGATLLAVQLGRSQYGRRMLAVRDSELASVSVGVPVVRTKIVAFIMSAVFAAVAGWVYAYVVGFVSPSTFDLFASVNFLVAVILGGAGRVLGAWFGAAYIVLVPEAFTGLGYPNLFPILGGAVLIAVALLLPGGLVEGAALLLAAATRRVRA
ncbi:MAG: branched-chain amino acid ABC transporter permease [Acetobacteraceae bacterium]|nr:branched-chain amino acid ABC transporter permease [Acetobacteraceae bacterium]